MNSIKLDISSKCKEFDKSLLQVIKRAVLAVFDFFDKDEPYSLSMLICSENKIKELNLTYRGVDRVTDVLSFPSEIHVPETDELFLGDIVISYPTAVRQAEKYQHPVSHELALLSIHGVLHLLGYDHSELADETEMWRLQETILNSIGYDIKLLPGESYAQE